MEIELIILTMSVKYNGYCVAGIDRQTGKWVRLVTGNEAVDGALFNRDITDVSGFLCKPLDVVRVRVKGNRPTAVQPENVLVDNRYRWLKINRLSQKDFLSKYPPEEHGYIFSNNSFCLNFSEARQLKCSLIMVKVSNLITHCNEKNKTKATFWYNGNFYENISVTDREFFADKNRITGKKAVVVMSLANKPYNYQYYKFIAKIFLCE